MKDIINITSARGEEIHVGEDA